MSKLIDGIGAVVSLGWGTEKYIRDNQDLKAMAGKNPVLRFFYDLITADKLAESLGVHTGQSNLAKITWLKHRTEGLKAYLPKEQHVYLELAEKLYTLLQEENLEKLKDHESIREWVNTVYEFNDGIAADGATDLVYATLKILLSEALQAGATFGVGTALKFSKKILGFLLKIHAHHLLEKSEMQMAKTDEQSKFRMTLGDEHTIKALADAQLADRLPEELKGEDAPDLLDQLEEAKWDVTDEAQDIQLELEKDHVPYLIEHFLLTKILLNQVNESDQRSDAYNLTHQITGQYLPELKSTSDLVQDNRLLISYVQKAETAENVSRRVTFVEGQLESLETMKEKLETAIASKNAELATKTLDSPKKAHDKLSSEINTLNYALNVVKSKIKLFGYEAVLLNNLVGNLSKSPKSSVAQLDPHKKQFSREQDKSPSIIPDTKPSPVLTREFISEERFKKSKIYYPEYTNRLDKLNSSLKETDKLLEKLKTLNLEKPEDQKQYKNILRALTEIGDTAKTRIQKYKKEISIMELAIDGRAPACKPEFVKYYTAMIQDYERLSAKIAPLKRADALIQQGEEAREKIKKLDPQKNPSAYEKANTELKNVVRVITAEVSKAERSGLPQVIINNYCTFLDKAKSPAEPAIGSKAKKEPDISAESSLSAAPFFSKKRPMPINTNPEEVHVHLSPAR